MAKAFVPVPRPVQFLVEFDLLLSTSVVGNAGLDSHRPEIVPGQVGVITAIGGVL